MMQLPALLRSICRSVVLRQISAAAAVLALGGTAWSQDVAVASDLPRDLSPWGMFLAADWVVKSVMIGLLFAWVVTWTVLLAKSLELLAAKRSARLALDVLASARSLDDAVRDLGKVKGPFCELVRAAILELQMSADGMDREGIVARIASRLG